MNKIVALQTVGALSKDEAQRELEPYGLGDMKKAIMSAAGFTPEVMGGLVQAAVATLVDALQAEKPEGEANVPDHQTRIRAASELNSLVSNVGGLKTDPRDASKGDGHIVIVADFMKPSMPQPDSD